MQPAHQRTSRRTAGTYLRWVTGVLGDLAVTVGLFLLLFTGWQLWWTDVQADAAQAGIVTALSRDFAHGGSSAPPRLGNAFAILRIPRFGRDYARPLLEGTDHDILKRGVGHYTGTAPPGAVGNFSIAGHRTTYGKPFHNIERLRGGDTIVVETRATYYVYRVASHEIVSPADAGVLAPLPDRPGAEADGAWLTMTSCHPKYSAARRYVVHARLVGTYARSQGLPAGTLDHPGAPA
jgi:sortase A